MGSLGTMLLCQTDALSTLLNNKETSFSTQTLIFNYQVDEGAGVGREVVA
jgi:hypothetical protein